MGFLGDWFIEVLSSASITNYFLSYQEDIEEILIYDDMHHEPIYIVPMEYIQLNSQDITNAIDWRIAVQ